MTMLERYKQMLSANLQEICFILAAGLVRLLRHTAEDLARDAAHTGDQEESLLHFVANQSGHANPTPRRAT
jgi:hypothetical protein